MCDAADRQVFVYAQVHSEDVREAFARFIRAMADELRANQSKGDRTGERGWLTATRKDMDYELFDHAAKLHTSRRALERAELDYSVPKHEVDRLRKEVREHAADVANVALIIADCARAL